jgi:peptidoglycan hydrolase CwlO-like protein
MADINEVKQQVEAAIAPYKNNVIMGAVIIACIIFCITAFTVGRYHPAPSIVQEQADKQLADAKEKYQTDMLAKNQEIERLKGLQKESEKRFVEFKKRMSASDQKIANIKPPKTMKEAKQRIGRAGYVIK